MKNKENDNKEDINDNSNNDGIIIEKLNSSKIIVKMNNKKDDSFEILEKEREFNEDYDFSELSFKNIYQNNPLFKHVISHLSEYLKNKASDKETIECLSEFINVDEFSEEIINKILLNGIPQSLPCLRPLIWKTFIGFYPIKDLSKWGEVSVKKNSEYKKFKEKYNYYPNDIKEEIDKKILIQINKDLPRTRYDCPFFQEKNINNKNETNYDVLKRILFFYSKEHTNIGYIQGMNEIIAIIFYIFSKDDNPFIKEYSESDSYFTFEQLLEEIKDILKMDNVNYSDLCVAKQIKEIKKIIKKDEPKLFEYFQEIDFEIDNFVLRWILVMFAQFFTLDVAVNFWDRVFTQKNKMKFICYISVAIIKNNKDDLMKMDTTEIMEWARQLENKMNEIDIDNIVKIALKIQSKNEIKRSKTILEK